MTKTITLNVNGMSCGHCVSTVQKALKTVKGVKKADVDLSTKEAVVTAQEKTAVNALVSAVNEAGYQASLK